MSESEYDDLKNRKKKTNKKSTKKIVGIGICLPDDAWIPTKTSHSKALQYLLKNPHKFSRYQEHWEQCYIFHHVAMNLPFAYEMMFAVPNAGKRAMVERGMLTSQGLRKGVPDIYMDIPTKIYHGLRIELKKTGATNSALSEEQIHWITKYTQLGFSAHAAFGYKQAIDLIYSYLGKNQTLQ